MIIVSNFDNLIDILYTCAILVNFIPNFILCTLQPLKIIKKTRIHENYKKFQAFPIYCIAIVAAGVGGYGLALFQVFLV